MMTFGIVVYPGTNCERDVGWVVEQVLGQRAKYIWHTEKSLSGVDCVIIPGGFSYGDYVRAGAMAKVSPISGAIVEFANSGKPVMGICNGFQILLELGLLKGAMLPNKNLKFICKFVHVKVENNNSPFLKKYKIGEVLKIPIAHAEGNYTCPQEDYNEELVALKYCSPEGEVSERFNPNGSMNNIAGVLSEGGNVLGLMPHPERASEKILGSEDGLKMFLSVLDGI